MAKQQTKEAGAGVLDVADMAGLTSLGNVATSPTERALEDVQQALREQREALAIAISDRAEALARERKSREENDRCKIETGKTCQQRTQETADRMFPRGVGQDRWRVSIPGDKAQIAVEINADGEDAARGRYLALCGIRSTEHDVKVEKG